MSKFISQDLYTFAFTLIPDDLQASQLVLDAFRSLLLENELGPKFYNSYQQSKSPNLKNEPEYKLLLKKIYEIAKKRIGQISVNINQEEDIKKHDAAFYKLNTEERAVLVLRHRFKMNLNNISYITNMAKIETINQLNLARTSLINT